MKKTKAIKPCHGSTMQREMIRPFTLGDAFHTIPIPSALLPPSRPESNSFTQPDDKHIDQYLDLARDDTMTNSLTSTAPTINTEAVRRAL